MSRSKNRGKMQRIVKEGEFTPVVEDTTEDTQRQEANGEHNGEVINLDDVAFMVMIGRYKNGEPFFTNVNVNDIFTIKGLLGFADSEMEAVFADYRASKKSAKEGE